MATTYNFTDGSIAGHPLPAETTLHENKIVIRRNIIDFAKQTLDAGEGDIGQVLNIPAKTTVLGVGIRVITAETANGTLNLGYAGNDTWGDGVSIATINTTVGFVDGIKPVYFAAADTIDVVATVDSADVDIDGAKIEVFALMYKHADSF